jgi:hypothetical protein
MASETGYKGTRKPNSGQGEFNAHSFLIRQILSRVNTSTLVQVISVTNAGGVSPVGFVDVQMMVNQLDGYGNAIANATLHHLPYSRIQGGANAVIIDPQVGDIGIAVFADHDISSVASNKATSNPGSGRRFNISDGMYIGGLLNGAPTQYVQFSTAGINITSPIAISMNAPDIKMTAPTIEMIATTSITATTPTFTINGLTVLNGPLTQGTGAAGGAATMLGPLTVTNDVKATGTSLHTHVHSDPQGGNTGAPI